MRFVWVLAGLGLSVTAFAGWTSAATNVAVPRACTAADTRERAVLATDDPGHASQGPAYMRDCGAARAVVRVGGNRDARTRWLWL